MEAKKQKSSTFKIVIGVVIAILLIYFFFGGGLEKSANNQVQQIENQVALDFEKQYKIAKENGTAIDAYTQASLVSAAYLQANDQENYKKWKAIEKEEAKRAGMPQ